MYARWKMCLTLSALLATLVFGSLTHAQTNRDRDELQTRLPFAVVTVKNLDQSLKNIGLMFDSSGRSDMMDMINAVLEDRAGNLAGIDRERPLGMMFFLSDSLPPSPISVTYMPVSDINAFIRTASLGPAKPEKVEGKNEVYRFPFGRRNRGLNMVIRDGYAFVSMDESILEGELPDPVKITGPFVARYDLSGSLQLKNIPPLMRDFFVAALQSSAQAELQQRDNEPDSVHRMRKASGQSALELFSQVLRDGEQLTLGLETNPEERMAALEIYVEAKPESQFSEFMKNIGGRKSVFEPLNSDNNPLTMSLSWKMDRREKEMVSGMIDGFELGLREQLPESMTAAIRRMASVFRATAEQEHINGVFQFVPIRRDEFGLVGGMKLVGADAFASALREMLDEIGKLDEIDTVALDVHQHQGISFHQLIGKRSNAEEQRIYGGQPSLFIGAGNGVLWLGVGGKDVLSEIDFAIDLMLETPPGTFDGSSAPFQVVFRMLPWLDLRLSENETPQQRELVDDAMEKGKDAVRIDVRPTETGGRIRIQFEEGFVRLLGLILAEQYDRSQL